MSERVKVIYITTTGDNTLELPTPFDVEGYFCGLVEIAGKVVNLKGDLFLCCDFCEESVVGEIKLPVLRCIKRKQTGIVYNDINHVISYKSFDLTFPASDYIQQMKKEK